MTVQVLLRGETTADFRALPSDAAREAALRFLADLKSRPFLGQPLDDHPEIGDLSDCRKIYFDEQPNVAPRFRIVYRLRPDETRPRDADIIAIGRRARAAVYRQAMLRLGRSSPP